MDRKLILFVEDSEHDQEIYGKLLWYNGFDVEFAATGEAGLGFLERELPRLLVLDLHLPGVSGVEVCERVRADSRMASLLVVILTGRPKREFVDWADSMGCAGLLEKPITPLEVLYEVERLIGGAATGRPGRRRAARAGGGRAGARGAGAPPPGVCARVQNHGGAGPASSRDDELGVRSRASAARARPPFTGDTLAARRREGVAREEPPLVRDPNDTAWHFNTAREDPPRGDGTVRENPPVP